MENIKIKIAALANVILLIFLAALTVNKFSPEFLNADVIINSVMSLQNVTLFYWGQNRFINLLPLLASLFKDPVFNLYFVLYAAAITHYVLLFYFAKIAIAFSRADKDKHLGIKVFLVISLIFIVITKDVEIFSIIIWHIEYSLPVLTIIMVFWSTVAGHVNFHRWLILSIALIFVATGLNYSIIIFSCALVGAYVLYTKNITYHVVAFVLVSVFSFITWNFISEQYGSLPYSEFNIQQLPVNITSVVFNLIGAFNVSNVIMLILCFYIVRLLLSLIDYESVSSRSRIEFFTLSSIAVFCFSWMILFSINKWVEMNQFHYRYFTFLIYGFLIFVSFQTSKILSLVGYRASWLISGGSFILLVMILWGGFVQLIDYKIFKKVEFIAPDSNILYAGDYWLVWPSVFRDMMAGKHSFGLTYRGDGNKEKVKAFVDRQLSEKGHFSVLCLNDKPVNCKNQISGVIGPAFVDQMLSRGDGVSELILTQSATSLIYRDNSFASLPSNTGLLNDSSRVTNENSGYLFFGPYVPLRSGDYILKVYGSSESVNTAAADVVSNHGSLVHAQFALQSPVDRGVLVTGIVNIPLGVNDLEVRVYVSEADKLNITGYELLPR